MANIQKMIDIIVLNGTMPMQEKYPYESLTKENGWEDCPVPQMMGIPLMAKPIRPYSGQIPDQQFAVFMMIEPGLLMYSCTPYFDIFILKCFCRVDRKWLCSCQVAIRTSLYSWNDRICSERWKTLHN